MTASTRASAGVFAGWAAAGVGAFALAWLAGWATAGTRSTARLPTPIAAKTVRAQASGLARVAPLPALRRKPTPSRPARRRVVPSRAVAPPPPPAAPARRRAPPPPPPIVIRGKG